MRLPDDYEKYLIDLERKSNTCYKYEYIKNAKSCYSLCVHFIKMLHLHCSNSNIPDHMMSYLASLTDNSDYYDDRMPVELLKCSEFAIEKLTAMYKELTDQEDLYFQYRWTLTRPGRKKMREYLNAITEYNRKNLKIHEEQ